MQVIRQRYWMNPTQQLAWRPIDPYCVQEIPYYDLTTHYAGDATEGYFVTDHNAWNGQPSYEVRYQRKTSDGSIRETDLPKWTNFTNYYEGDIVGSTMPLNEIRNLYLRHQNVKSLLFNPSVHMPQLRGLFLRGNWITLNNLDFRNCVHIDSIDVSKGHLKGIQLPPTDANDVNNYFRFAYIGHYYTENGITNPFSPPEVIDAITKRAYFSRVPYTDPYSVGSRYKQLNTDSSNGHLYFGANKTLPYHKILAKDRNWLIQHLSIESFTVGFGSAASSQPFDLYTSHHNWNIQIPAEATWLTVDNANGPADVDNIQTVNFSVTENTTGAPRSTTIAIRKLKVNEPTFEFNFSAKVVITQAG